MKQLLSKLVGEKKQWKAMQARASVLPHDYRVVYDEITSYLWKFAGGDGMGTIAVLDQILESFETEAAHGRSVLNVTGPDVAAFCDCHLRDTSPPAESYTDLWRRSLNRDVADKLAH